MKTTEIRSMLKRNSLLFQTYMKLTDDLYRTNIIDFYLHRQVKSRDRIRRELDLMRAYWKCNPINYFRFRLYERDLSDEELLDYIPQYYFYNFYVPSIYDNARIRYAASKILMNDYMISRNIRTPRAIARVVDGKIIHEGIKIHFGEFSEILKKADSARFFIKPEMGKGGKGISIIEKVEGTLFVSSRLLTEDLFKGIVGQHSFLIQEGIIQRSDMMEIYPGSVNTLRVITQNFGGEARIVAVLFRMGRDGKYVDNAGSGGIAAAIDLDTGTISDYAQAIKKNNIRYECHPDTGFRFGGFVLRDWENIKSGILDFAAKASDFPDVGWDIAVTEEGPVAIEMNLNYGIDLQRIVGGLRRRMNIEPYKSHWKVKVNEQ